MVTAMSTTASEPASLGLAARLDDEHLAVYRAMPDDLLHFDDIQATRRRVAGMRATMDRPAHPDGLRTDEHEVLLPDGATAIIRLYRPANGPVPSPVLYWIHGGGMVLGDLEMDDPWCAVTADALDIVIAAIDYRLAPEYPFPTPVEDCYAGIRWLATSAGDLGIDPARIAIGGASAGGGLAAATALLARERNEPSIAFQLLVYPMLDDRNCGYNSPSCDDPKVWNRRANAAGWSAYLGERAGTDDVPPHAAPARATDLSNLPATHVSVGDLDLFLDEDIDFARRLAAAGVPVELHVLPGAFHGSDTFVSRSSLSRRWLAERRAALARGLGLVHPAAQVG